MAFGRAKQKLGKAGDNGGEKEWCDLRKRWDCAIPSLEGCREGFNEQCISYRPLPATSQSAAPLPGEGIKKASAFDGL